MTDWKQQFDEKFEYVGIALNWYTHCLYSISKKSGEEHLLDIKKFINTELNQARKQERDKVLELLVDEEENEHAGHAHDIDGNWCIRCSEAISGRHPDYESGRNQLRAELRQQIKEMK